MQTHTFHVLICLVISGFMILTNNHLIAQRQNMQARISVSQMDSALNLTDLQEAKIHSLMSRQEQLMRQMRKLRKENPQEVQRRYSELRQNYDYELAGILSRDQWAVYQQMMLGKTEMPVSKNFNMETTSQAKNKKQKKSKGEKKGSGAGKQMLTGGIGFLTNELVRYGMKWLRRNRR